MPGLEHSSRTLCSCWAPVPAYLDRVGQPPLKPNQHNLGDHDIDTTEARPPLRFKIKGT